MDLGGHSSAHSTNILKVWKTKNFSLTAHILCLWTPSDLTPEWTKADSLLCARANPLPHFSSWTFSVSEEARTSPQRRTLYPEGPTGSEVPVVHHTSSLSFLPTQALALTFGGEWRKNSLHPIWSLGRRYFHPFPSKLKWLYLFLHPLSHF